MGIDIQATAYGTVAVFGLLKVGVLTQLNV